MLCCPVFGQLTADTQTALDNGIWQWHILYERKHGWLNRNRAWETQLPRYFLLICGFSCAVKEWFLWMNRHPAQIGFSVHSDVALVFTGLRQCDAVGNTPSCRHRTREWHTSTMLLLNLLCHELFHYYYPDIQHCAAVLLTDYSSHLFSGRSSCCSGQHYLLNIHWICSTADVPRGGQGQC